MAQFANGIHAAHFAQQAEDTDFADDRIRALYFFFSLQSIRRCVQCASLAEIEGKDGTQKKNRAEKIIIAIKS